MKKERDGTTTIPALKLRSALKLKNNSIDFVLIFGIVETADNPRFSVYCLQFYSYVIPHLFFKAGNLLNGYDLIKKNTFRLC
jgi:hypothetical protein